MLKIRYCHFAIIVLSSILNLQTIFATPSTQSENQIDIPVYISKSDSSASIQFREYLATLRDSIQHMLSPFGEFLICMTISDIHREDNSQSQNTGSPYLILQYRQTTHDSSHLLLLQPNPQFQKNDLTDIALQIPSQLPLPDLISLPDNQVGTLLAAILLQRTGHAGPAAFILHRLLEQEPHVSPAFHFLLADSHLLVALHNSGEQETAAAHLDSACASYERTIEAAIPDSLTEFTVALRNNYAIALHLANRHTKALEQLKLATILVDSSGITAGATRIYHNLAAIYLSQADWKQALDTYNKFLIRAEKSADRKTLALVYDNMGSIYHILLQRLNAIRYFQKSLEIYTELADTSGIISSLQYLGNINKDKKDFSTALSYYRRALHLARVRETLAVAFTCLSDMGEVFLAMNQPDSALFYATTCKQLSQSAGNNSAMIRASNLMADIYLYKHQPDSAIACYLRSLKLAVNDKPQQAYIYGAIAHVHNRYARPETALEYYEAAANIYRQLQSFETLSITYFNMGLLHLKLNNYPEGYNLIKHAMELDERYGFANLQGEKDFLLDIERIMQRSSN